MSDKTDIDTKKSEIDWQPGDIARVKEGWDRAGTWFAVLGPAVFLKQWWVPIEDPSEPDPTFFKEAALSKVEEKIAVIMSIAIQRVMD